MFRLHLKPLTLLFSLCCTSSLAFPWWNFRQIHGGHKNTHATWAPLIEEYVIEDKSLQRQIQASLHLDRIIQEELKEEFGNFANVSFYHKLGRRCEGRKVEELTEHLYDVRSKVCKSSQQEEEEYSYEHLLPLTQEETEQFEKRGSEAFEIQYLDNKCYEAGDIDPDLEVEGYHSSLALLCPICKRRMRISNHVFPRIIATETICSPDYEICRSTQDSEIMTPPKCYPFPCNGDSSEYYGTCVQRKQSITVLRRSGECDLTIRDGLEVWLERWVPVNLEIRVGCECLLNKDTPVHKYCFP